jgi:hypothetical protein
MPANQRMAVDRGLDWVAQKQADDGHWDADGRWHSTTMTARAGLVLLMEGSTTQQGKYKDQIRKAVDFLTEHSQTNGLLCARSTQAEARDYMEGHGFAMLFLASVYGQEKDGERRKKLEDVLKRAVEFCGKAQSELGGWHFVTARDVAGWDVGDVAASQMQGLGACQNAGIPGTKPILAKGLKYLEKCTTPGGGVIYSLASAQRNERPGLTAAALVCSFSAGQYDSDLVKKWLRYCGSSLPVIFLLRPDPFGYTNYYYAQALHILGDSGGRDLPTWSSYKKAVFGQLLGSQGQDGSWKTAHDSLHLTTVNLTILQLDSTKLPIYRRAARK